MDVQSFHHRKFSQDNSHEYNKTRLPELLNLKLARKLAKIRNYQFEKSHIIDT